MITQKGQNMNLPWDKMDENDKEDLRISIPYIISLAERRYKETKTFDDDLDCKYSERDGDIEVQCLIDKLEEK